MDETKQDEALIKDYRDAARRLRDLNQRLTEIATDGGPPGTLQQEIASAKQEAGRKLNLAFTEIYARHAQRIANIARQNCPNPSDADDYIIEMQVRMLRAIKVTYKLGAVPFAGYFFSDGPRSVRHSVLVDDVRKHGKHRNIPSLDEPVRQDNEGTLGDFVPGQQSNPQKIAISRIILDGFIFTETTPRQRKIVLLHDVDGWIMETIAERLSISLGTVSGDRKRVGTEAVRFGIHSKPDEAIEFVACRLNDLREAYRAGLDQSGAAQQPGGN